MRSPVVLALLAGLLCPASVSAQSKANLGKHDSHFLQLVVPEGAADEILGNLVALKVDAKANKMHERVFLMLQTAATKVEQALAKEKTARKKAGERAEKQVARDAKEKAAKAKEAEAAKRAGASDDAAATAQLEFTRGAQATRPMKASMRSPRCNVPRFATLAEARAAAAAGKHDLAAMPFIVAQWSGARRLDSEVRARWSAPALSALPPNVTISYHSPHAAKVQREQGQQGQGGGAETMEVFQPTRIPLREYFANCFGSKKRSGYETEHCAQAVPLQQLLQLFPPQEAEMARQGLAPFDDLLLGQGGFAATELAKGGFSASELEEAGFA
eukprot:g6047.t1